MKFKLRVNYQGQSHVFEVEHDDECLSDESYSQGVDFNNELVTEDFLQECELAVIERTHDEIDESCYTCRGTGIGLHGDPNTSVCSSCRGSGIARRARYQEDF